MGNLVNTSDKGKNGFKMDNKILLEPTPESVKYTYTVNYTSKEE